MRILIFIPAIFLGLITLAESFYKSKDYNLLNKEQRKEYYAQLATVQSIDTMMSFIDSLRQNTIPDESLDSTIYFRNHPSCSDFLRLMCHLVGYDTIYICGSAPQYTRFYPFQLDSLFDWYAKHRGYINVDSLHYFWSVQDYYFLPYMRRLLDLDYAYAFIDNNFKDSTARSRMSDLLLERYDNWIDKLNDDDKQFVDSIMRQFPHEELLLEKIKMDSAIYIYRSMNGKWRHLGDSTIVGD